MTLQAAKPHPIYVKAAADDRAYIHWADQAKLIRLALSRAFPGTKFYVRTDSFAGGAAVEIYYDGRKVNDAGQTLYTEVDYDGEPYAWVGEVTYDQVDHSRGRWAPVRKPGAPKRKDVEAVCHPFRGGDFDGMIDLAYGVSTWLCPDGSVAYGKSDGTTGSHPGYDEPRPEPGAILVRFLANYVSVNDELPYDVRVKAGH